MEAHRKRPRTSPRHEESKGDTRGKRKHAASDANGNGHPTPEGDDIVDRAEEIVDRVAEEVARLTSKVGRQLLQLTYRAREEIEDIWAEANSIRRGK